MEMPVCGSETNGASVPPFRVNVIVAVDTVPVAQLKMLLEVAMVSPLIVTE